jgi:PAS domain-containing protein
MRYASALVLVALLSLSSGCKNAYYGAWEKLGWEKRDILADRVEDARDAQAEAKEQFKTTLERFQELTNFDGGKLEAQYKKLSAEYEDAKDSAEAVTKRINAVDSVAQDMFKEWRQELKQYTDAGLQRQSEEKLEQSQERYQELLAAMRRSEASMKPVLEAFNNQVLFLKHNLNAQAIASLDQTAAQIDQDVQKLIKDMEAAIAEADAYIGELKKG